MTGTEINRNNSTRFQAVFAFFVLCAFLAALFAGAAVPAGESCMILPKSPFGEDSFFKTAVRICFLDTAVFWILSFARSEGLTVTASVFVFFFRGLVLGCSFRMFVANSVTFVSVVFLISYLIITLLALVYDVFLNVMGERGALCRIASCLVATGAAAAIRLLPLLLLI